ncbi:hypothetical protein Lser_V15G04060 [Lactuca serriola]
MSSCDNYGLPHPFGKKFLYKDDIPQHDQGERLILYSCCSGTSLPPPPPIILPDPQVERLKKYKVTQALLAIEHQDVRSVCAHVLEMKSQIDRMGMLGVDASRKLVGDLVLQSLPELYSEFIKDYNMTDHDMTLIDLADLLVSAESAMIWRTGKTNLIGRSIPQTSMDIDNGNIGSPEMISLSKGKGKAKSVIFPCTIPKESICFYFQDKGYWLRSFHIYLKDRKDGKVKKFDSISGNIHYLTLLSS